MKTIDRYIARSFIQCFLIVLAILGFLFTFFEFITELGDVGKGQYQLAEAVFYVVLRLPERITHLIPPSSLLAGIIALGLLADNNELVAMRAAGISVRRICYSVMGAATIPMLLGGILAEYIAPPLEHRARTQRLVALTEADITFTAGGFWARNGPVFIHVRKIRRGGIPADVDIFEWDPEGRLSTFTYARSAHVKKDKQWVLTDIEQRTFTDRGITDRKMPTLALGSFLNPEQLAIQERSPETLSPSDLYQYVRLLRDWGQNADHYELAFWQKVTSPLSTGAMVLLALTFVFGPIRGNTAGFRIMAGSIIGVVVYFLNQILGHLGLLFSFNLALAATMPAAAILCLALWLLSRSP
jgi:lipopolysaccharide export system permease protein